MCEVHLAQANVLVIQREGWRVIQQQVKARDEEDDREDPHPVPYVARLSPDQTLTERRCSIYKDPDAMIFGLKQIAQDGFGVVP